MNGPSDDAAGARPWVEKAENDLRNAEHTLTMAEGCPFDTVAFHAHQCAEKYLKALLVLKSEDFPRTHDLRVLLQMAAAAAPVELSMGEVLELNRYAVEARYPGDWEPIGRPDAEHAVDLARQVRAAVRAVLPDGALPA
jgi:HEPN domain-containing protein